MLTLNQNDRIGKYCVSYLIKEGTSCGTYKVTDTDGKAFFLKLFDDENTPEKYLSDGEIREIAYGRKVNHPNVIPYVDDGFLETGGRKYSYIVYEFIGGRLLSERINSGSPFTVDEGKAIMSGILLGLDYLHSLELVHNDITPGNILLETAGDGAVTPRIIDLGHLNPSMSGTPPFPVNDLSPLYSSPETLSGFFYKVGDVFSASAIMYAMFAGRAPWFCQISGNESFQEKKNKVRAARKQELDTEPLASAGLEEDLIELIRQGLSLDSKTRAKLGSLIKVLAGEEALQKNDNAAKRPEPSGEKEDKHTQETKANVEIKPAEGGGFKDVAGMEKLKADLTNRVIWVLRDKEKAEKYRLSPPNGMILYGPPGCGKTFFAEKFAEETHFNFVLVNGSDLGSIYIHGTQGKIADLFKEAEQKAPTILCFDEFDSFVPSRSSEAAAHRPEEVNEFLGQLNNCAKRGIFVIGTTNRLDLIDPAVLRKGRMDLHIEIPAPDEETRRKMFDIHLKARPLADDVDTSVLAKETDNYAASDIAFIVNEAAMVAALADVPISQEHLLNSVRSNKSSLKKVKAMPKIGFKN